jgi:hypothetical protein
MTSYIGIMKPKGKIIYINTLMESYTQRFLYIYGSL